MIEHLFKKKMIREFLKKYSTNQWPQVISDVFEIGVLNLQNSFHTMYFTKEQFQNIINDLKSQLDLSPKVMNQKENKSPSQVRSAQMAFKPSKNWRSGHSEKTEFPKEMHNDDYSEISRENERDEENQTENIRLRKTNKLHNKRIVDDYNYDKRNKSRSTSRSKMNYKLNQAEIKKKNKEHDLRVQSIESKIKGEVNNDKTTYQFIQNQAKQPKEESKKTNNTPKKSNKAANINKVNYVISYDKELKPESIQKKTKQNEEVVYCKKKDKEVIRKQKHTPNNENVNNRDINTEKIEQMEEELVSEEYDQNQFNQVENSHNQEDDQEEGKVEEEDLNYPYRPIQINNSEQNQAKAEKPIKNEEEKQQSHKKAPRTETNKNIYQKEEKEFKSLNNCGNDNQEEVYHEGNYNQRNQNQPLYYDKKLIDNSNYQPSSGYNRIGRNNQLDQFDGNENYHQNYDNNDYQSLSNSQKSLEKEQNRDEGEGEDNIEGYQQLVYGQPNHQNIREDSYSKYNQQPRNEEEEDYYDNNNRTYQYHRSNQYPENLQMENNYSNNRNSSEYVNKQQPPYQLPTNSNDQMNNQYSEQEQYNSNNDLNFKQSNQNHFSDNQENEGQLSMLNLSDRTKNLFRREMNNWIPQDNESQRKLNHHYLQKRYVYQIEGNANHNLSSSNDQQYGN